MEREQITNQPAPFPEKIADFIRSHHVANITAVSNSQPWTFHVFFVFLESDPAIIFLSDKEALHYRMMVDNPIVSGGIALETEQIGKIMGVQFTGIATLCKDSQVQYRMRYLKRFPYAIFKGADIWLLKFSKVKFTDNSLIFGKKILWKGR